MPFWEMITIIAIVVFNGMVLGCIIWYFNRMCGRLDKTYQKTQDDMLICTDTLIQQHTYTNRWVKVVAKMVNDDRIRLQEHDAKVEEMHEIARKLKEKFLKDT